MIKNVFKIALLLLLVAACSEHNSESEITIPSAQKEPLSTAQINAEIDKKTSVGADFKWKTASDHLLWSAVVQGHFLVSVGFGNNAADFDRSKSAQAARIQDELLQTIAQYEDRSLEEILVSSDRFLNQFNVLIHKQETIIALRKSPFIRYVEPADYPYVALKNAANRSASASSSGSSGCGFDTQTLSTADYTTVSPNAKAPWTFYQHNIPTAWNYSSGRGVTIGIIDTGVSPNQTLLGTNFNNGDSAGRTIQKFGVYVDSIWPWSTTTDGPNDQCGHGTSMASVAAAPRNNRGLPVGVAYNANLVTYRAAANVVLDGYQEQEGVKNAFTALANNTNVKIISMSMGYVFSVGKIEDAIKYAYSKGKLIFCAAGTSTSFTTFVGVIFPAWMPETIAVTGVKEGATPQKCDVCHSGSKVDFTVVMQRAATGNTVPVNSYYDNQTNYVGGSSVATATTAGIAALVWAKNTTWTRDQVLAKMRQSASFYPNRNAELGYGNINAAAAVQ